MSHCGALPSQGWLQGAGRGGGGAELALRWTARDTFCICLVGLGYQENSHTVQSKQVRLCRGYTASSNRLCRGCAASPNQLCRDCAASSNRLCRDCAASSNQAETTCYVVWAGFSFPVQWVENMSSASYSSVTG